jgi:hypothetical protein
LICHGSVILEHLLSVTPSLSADVPNAVMSLAFGKSFAASFLICPLRHVA